MDIPNSRSSLLAKRPAITSALALVLIALAILVGTLIGHANENPSGSKPPFIGASTPAPRGATVAFYGDSYTYGEQASSAAHRWSTLLCQQEGWIEANASINGLGFVANRDVTVDAVQTVVEAHPDVIVVTMGLNDTFIAGQQIDAIASAIHSDFARFRSEAPQARLIVVEPFWIPAPVSPEYTAVAEAVRAGAVEAGADYVAGAGDWLTGHPEWRADDQYQHPNDNGYAELARRMTIELQRLGVIDS